MLAENPSDAPTLSLLWDALMEMGRYSEAGDAHSRMAAMGGNLFSYNRPTYDQFVTGHPDQALAWMNQAVQAVSAFPLNVAVALGICCSRLAGLPIPNTRFDWRCGRLAGITGRRPD
jgi:hypothetical protein